MEYNDARNDGPGYVQKIWIKGSIYALIVILILLFKTTFSVFLLILAGALIALFFRGLGNLICRKTRWKSGVCLTISILGTLILIAGAFTLIGSTVESQITQLVQTLPSTLDNAKLQLQQSSLGKIAIEKATSPGSQEKLQGLAATVFKSTFGVFGDIYIVLFLGLFFTAAPAKYTDGVISLIPQGGKRKGKEVLGKLQSNLQKWLKGKIFSMTVVMILTAIGLAIIGLPMWLALAIIAGLLNFIPNFGPLLAMIPAILVALMQGPATAGIVAGMYILIQVLESNFITPFVQQKLINIPPALIIVAQLLISPLTGGWGLVLATPVMLIIMTLVQELYIKKQE